ncbi:BrnT family toxin [uncultured Devosia sp.]|uniref:BrnT family toxin n=1 Tax=uncultured Devosia sp. TaxID=211434 RepID=UPI0035CAC0D4
MDYEWDEGKNGINYVKHGVGFEIVLQFDWDTSVIRLDQRYEYGEVRFRAFGRIDGQSMCVAFTPRGPKLRIVSVRFVHEKEAKRYGI